MHTYLVLSLHIDQNPSGILKNLLTNMQPRSISICSRVYVYLHAYIHMLGIRV